MGGYFCFISCVAFYNWASHCAKLLGLAPRIPCDRISHCIFSSCSRERLCFDHRFRCLAAICIDIVDRARYFFCFAHFSRCLFRVGYRYFGICTISCHTLGGYFCFISCVAFYNWASHCAKLLGLAPRIPCDRISHCIFSSCSRERLCFDHRFRCLAAICIDIVDRARYFFCFAHFSRCLFRVGYRYFGICTISCHTLGGYFCFISCVTF